eukprot:1158274-Pelagomonas_calceolata.AAC.39
MPHVALLQHCPLENDCLEWQPVTLTVVKLLACLEQPVMAGLSVPATHHLSSTLRSDPGICCGICLLSTLTLYEGLLLSTPDKFTNAEQFLRLWRNEALRVFHDRLICPEDKHMVNSQLAEVVEQYFEPCAAYTLADPILFGDYRCGVCACVCARAHAREDACA